MSSLLVNRAHSANPRSARRSPTNRKASLVRQRPTTSVGARRSYTDVFVDRISTPSEVKPSHYRSRSATTRSSRSSQPVANQLEIEDIQDLLQYLEHDDQFVVKIDSLNSYHKLIDSINLYKTPLNYKLLCELQRLENRVIQKNACRDVRFHSLLDILPHQYIPESDQNDSKIDTPPTANLTVYQTVDDHIEY